MSLLKLLEDDSVENSIFPDDGVSNTECVAYTVAVEETEKLWSDHLNSELLNELGEVEQWLDPSDDQLLQDVRRIESSLEPLLCPDAVAKVCANLSQYQGPAVPIPTLQYDQVVLLTSTPSPHESVTFDLEFISDISSDCVHKMDLPQSCQLKEPCSED